MQYNNILDEYFHWEYSSSRLSLISLAFLY